MVGIMNEKNGNKNKVIEFKNRNKESKRPAIQTEIKGLKVLIDKINGDIETPLNYEQLDGYFSMLENKEKINEETKYYVMYTIASELENNKNYEMAAKIFYNAGQILKSAELYEKAGKLYAAAIMYKEIGLYLNAAEIYEQLNYYKFAADIYLKLGIAEQAIRCAEMYKQNKLHPEYAADIYVKLGYLDSALEVAKWAHDSGYHLQSAHIYEKLGNYEKAITEYILSEELYFAEQLALKHKKYKRAANIYLRDRKYYNAGQMYIKLREDAVKSGDQEYIDEYELKIASCGLKLLDLQQYELASELYKQVGWYGSAGDALMMSPKTDLYETAGDYYKKSGELLNAADAYFKAGKYDKSGKLYEKIGDVINTANAYIKAGNYEAAKRIYEKHGAKSEVLYVELLEEIENNRINQMDKKVISIKASNTKQ